VPPRSRLGAQAIDLVALFALTAIAAITAPASRCIQRPDSEGIIRDREHPWHHDHFDADAPAGDVIIHR
jgi:hypothetical protein